MEAKPNEPRGDIYMATTGNYLGLIPTLAHPEMVGVNPEVAHEQMAGLNFTHAVAQAWEAGKLFHIDLNDQAPGRYDQDFRFGAANPKSAFFLVKFLEDVGYDGPRHFDAHAYRTENYDGVKDFARGCMRTYLILKEKAARWNADKEIQAIVKEINEPSMADALGREVLALRTARRCSRTSSTARRWPPSSCSYERLDQLTMEVLLGAQMMRVVDADCGGAEAASDVCAQLRVAARRRPALQGRRAASFFFFFAGRLPDLNCTTSPASPSTSHRNRQPLTSWRRVQRIHHPHVVH